MHPWLASYTWYRVTHTSTDSSYLQHSHLEGKVYCDIGIARPKVGYQQSIHVPAASYLYSKAPIIVQGSITA